MMICTLVCRAAACRVGSDCHLLSKRQSLLTRHNILHYSRNEVEAASKEAIHAEGLLQGNIPSSITEIPAGAFKVSNQVVTVAILESVTLPLKLASWKSNTIPKSVTSIGDLMFVAV